MTKRVAYYTLGCKLNFSESSTIAREFEQGGFVRAQRGELAQICVINTCSVTADADKKCRNVVRRAVRENPGAIIAVTGCYAQLKPEEVAGIQGVTIVLGNNGKGELVSEVLTRLANPYRTSRGVTQGSESSEIVRNEKIAGEAGTVSETINKGKPTEKMGNFSEKINLEKAVKKTGKVGENYTSVAPQAIVHNHCEAAEISNFFAAFSSGDRTRAFLKVQDGCSYNCSYCTIPRARGASRNISIAQLTAQAQEIARAGQREIILTGVNIGDFGRTTGESFYDLIRTLDLVEGIDRYRISSIEPNLLTDQIIEFTAGSSKFQPHFHIPLQAGSDKILEKMRRRYTTSRFAERIGAVRRAMPEAFIGIDIIVGFPTEGDAEFEETYGFLENIAPSFLHIFPYSERADTPALELGGKVSPAQKQARAHRLEELNVRLQGQFSEKFVGREVEILVEATRRDGKMMGYSENYLKVEIPYDRSKINTLQRVLIRSIAPSGNAVGVCL